MKTPKALPLILILTILSFLFSYASNTSTVRANNKTRPKVIRVTIKDAALRKLVKDNDKLFSIYGTLRPYEKYSIKKFHIPKKDLSEITGEGFEGDSIDGDILIEYYKNEIYVNLKSILTYKTIYRYDLKKLLVNGDLSVIVSPDGKLYNLVYDENTGGSYRSRVSIIHYRAKGRLIYNSFGLKSLEDDRGDSSAFNTDGYGSIDTIHTSEGVKYILQGSVAGCNTCLAQYIDLVKFRKSNFISDFGYTLDTRSYDDNTNQLIYDERAKTISVDYVTDDLKTECDCDKEAKDKTTNLSVERTDTTKQIDETPPPGKKCSCLFVFNGKTFVESTSMAKHKQK